MMPYQRQNAARVERAKRLMTTYFATRDRRQLKRIRRIYSLVYGKPHGSRLALQQMMMMQFAHALLPLKEMFQTCTMSIARYGKTLKQLEGQNRAHAMGQNIHFLSMDPSPSAGGVAISDRSGKPVKSFRIIDYDRISVDDIPDTPETRRIQQMVDDSARQYRERAALAALSGKSGLDETKE